MQIPKYFAHRGIISQENTISGFERALELGAPGIELDVHFYHDRLKVTHYKSLLGRKSVPYFEEVLDAILEKCKELKRKKPILNIDLKGRGTGKIAVKQIKGKWDIDEVILTSFMVLTGDSRVRYQELVNTRDYSKDVPIGIIGYANDIKRYLHFIRELKACALITKYSNTYTKEFVDTVHKHNLYAIPWNVNDKNYEEVVKTGVDGVIKDVHDQ